MAGRKKDGDAERYIYMPLAGIRAAMGATQDEVAHRSEITQGEISKLETKDDLDRVEVGTLRRYLGALGAELELVVVMKSVTRVRLREALAGDELALVLREARERAGLTHQELADRLGVRDASMVRRYEKGEVEPSTAYCRRVWAICLTASREQGST